MSEALFKSFAIVGAGPHINIPIVKVVCTDYTSASEVMKILHENKVEVLISTVTLVFGGVLVQNVLADATKEAGVKLFVPSEFGTAPPATGLAYEKHDFAGDINGLFHEFVPWLTTPTETGKFHIMNNGDMPGSFTAIPDVAGYVAHILMTQLPSRLLDVEVHIEGQCAMLSEISALYKGSVPVVHCNALPTEGVVTAEVHTLFQRCFEVGGVSCGWNPETGIDDVGLEKKDNSLWEGHQWLTVGEVLGL
ncbi:hypothetical protein DFH29DRAFT_1017454 [Suillus ampliporus]|nr:hypothetical protein DFH29DRAFT_1017454 [Suillus ampliporus]